MFKFISDKKYELYILVPKKRSIDIDTKFDYDLVRSITK